MKADQSRRMLMKRHGANAAGGAGLVQPLTRRAGDQTAPARNVLNGRKWAKLQDALRFLCFYPSPASGNV
jgi:hypothetical protein